MMRTDIDTLLCPKPLPYGYIFSVILFTYPVALPHRQGGGWKMGLAATAPKKLRVKEINAIHLQSSLLLRYTEHLPCTSPPCIYETSRES